jgi:hypothetical protein
MLTLYLLALVVGILAAGRRLALTAFCGERPLECDPERSSLVGYGYGLGDVPVSSDWSVEFRTAGLAR